MSLAHPIVASICISAGVSLWSQISDLNISRTLKFWVGFGFCYSRSKGLFIPFIVQDLFHSLFQWLGDCSVSPSWSYIFIYCCISCKIEYLKCIHKCSSNKLCFQKALVHFLWSIGMDQVVALRYSFKKMLF